MQFAATLIEYLVSGTVALIWLFPLISRLFGVELEFDEAKVILLIPLIYVLGMYVDAVASVMLTRFKKDRSPESHSRPYERTVRIVVWKPELAPVLQGHVSRDRIARGVFLNALLATGVALFVEVGSNRWKLVALAATAAIVSFFMWQRFDRLTAEFKRRALEEMLVAPGKSQLNSEDKLNRSSADSVKPGNGP